MAIIPDQLFGDSVSQRPTLRAFPREDGIIRGTLAQFLSAATLEHLFPLYFDDVAGAYKVWVGQSNEVNTLTSNATPGTGSFTLTVDGQTTAAIPVASATAAAVQAALEALSNVAPGDVAAVDSGSGANLGAASHVVTLTWGGAFAGQNVAITINTSGMTGNAVVLATSTQGGSDASDGSDIDAFLWAPDAAVEASTVGTLIVNVLVRGVLHAADVPVPSGESRADLNEALLGSSLREKGFDIQGLPNFH